MRIYFFVCTFLLTTFKLQGQEAVLESGISFSNMIYNTVSVSTISTKTTSVNNFIASVKYLHHFNKKLYWEAGIGYEGKGAKTERYFYQVNESDRIYHLHYLDCSLSLMYTIKNISKHSDFEVGLGSYFSALLAGKEVGHRSFPSDASINNSIIISRNNELNQLSPPVFRPFDLGSIFTARIRKKKFFYSTTYRYGFNNLFADFVNNDTYHHSAFSISVGYILLQKNNLH